MNSLEVLSLLVAAFFGGLVIANTVSRFLLPKKSPIWNVILVMLFMFTLANRSWIGDENPLILFPFFIAAFLLCYQGTWYAKLITGLIFFSLLEPICMMIDTPRLPTYAKWSTELVILSIKLCVCLLLWLLVRRMAPKNGISLRSGKLWGLLGGLSLVPLFSTLSFTIWNAKFFDYEAYSAIVYRLAYTILPFTLLSAFSLLLAMVVLSRHEELEQRQILAELRELYYQSLKREQVEVRTLRHDLSNHLSVAQSLLAQDDYGGTRRYLEELSQSPALMSAKSFCENEIANAILTSKSALAEQEGVELDWEVSLPKDPGVSEIDLAALLGNALDNAIEATRRVQEKAITVRARADKGMLMLRVVNTCQGVAQRTDGKFQTTKQDVIAHGFGLAGMEEIAERYGGSLDAGVSDGRFELYVCLPLR